MTAFAVPAVAQVNVAVDAANAVRVVDSRTFGLNAAVWDGSFSDPQSLVTLKAAGVKFLRYPGGSTADNFSWQTSTPVLEAWTINNFVTYADFDAFAVSAVAAGADVVITANYVTGSAEEAAGWVAYSNITKGYGFKYWEVGNECYGLYEYDPPLTRTADAQEYAIQAVQYIRAMKAVDPTIKVGVAVDASEDSLTDGTALTVVNPVTGVSHSGWTPIVLTTMKQSGVLPDFLIYHYYDQDAGLEDDVTLLQDSHIWAASSQELRSILTDYLGAAGAGVELLVTENNSVDTNPGKQTTSLVNGLFLADSICSLMQTEYNALVWWDFHNGQQSNFNDSSSLYGWRQYGDYGIESHAHDRYPTFYAMELMTNFAAGGDVVVTASSDNDLLSAYAVKRLNGTLSILLINKSPKNTYPVNLTVSGFSPKPTVNVFSYGIPQDNAAKLGTGSPDVATSTFSNGGQTFSESIAPYSLTLLSLSSAVSPPTAINEPVSQTVGVGSTAVFSFTASGTPDLSFQWFLNGHAIAGATGSTLVIKDATPADAGTYVCVASNSVASVTSSAATLSLRSAVNPGRLINISCRAQVGAGANVIIAGFVVGGSGTSGAQPVLARASGPSLALPPFVLRGILPDPDLTLDNLSLGTVVAANDGWNGSTAIAKAAAAAGAFAWSIPSSKDSAVLRSLPPDRYTMEIAGASGDTGIALAEVYDATPAGAYTAASPRLVNISARVRVGTGENILIAGFVIGGDTSKTVLVRASGPALSTFDVPGTLGDPTLQLNNASGVIATNTGWGGDAAIAATAAAVGAFSWGSAATADSALLVTLPPGAYTAQVFGASGDSGVALVEVYDVP